jgi:hypothetical protein
MQCMTGVSVAGLRHPSSREQARRSALMTTGHRGNKSYLPTKICLRCQRPMTWRKAWEKNWASIKYCSDACRRRTG